MRPTRPPSARHPDASALAGVRYAPLWLAAAILVGSAFRLVQLRSAPPGLHFDEAVYGLQALEIYHGSRPIFFPAYTGREPLYMYLMAVVFRLVGIGALGIRLTSALIGIATIPLIYLLMRELYGQRVGLLAAALLALSYWHLTVSRNGYPNILIPLMACLALFWLWRGYRDGSVWQLMLGGAVTGAILYTYLAARFLPVTVALFFLYALLVDRRRFLSRFGGLALAGLAALLVFAPLGYYFTRHPQYFWERANQVLLFREVGLAGTATMMLGNLAHTLGGLFIKGDVRPHFNLPGRPILTAPSALFLGIGAVVVLAKWRRPEYMLLPIWLVGMSLPAILTKEVMPQGQRMFGAIPAIYGLVALGIDRALAWMETGPNARVQAVLPAVTLVVILGLLAYEGTETRRIYFDVWTKQRETFYIFHADYVPLAEEARRAMDEGHTVVIQSLEYKHPTVVFLEPRTADVLWTAGASVFVVPGRATEVLYLWPRSSNPLRAPIRAAMERLVEPVDEVEDPFGRALLHIGRLRQEVWAEENEAAASFAGQVEVLDWSLPESARRDEPLEVLVRWRVGHVGAGRVLTLHLRDERGVLWAQDGQMGYFADQWQQGDTVYQLFTLSLPGTRTGSAGYSAIESGGANDGAGIPAGRYEAHLIFSPEGGDALPVTRDGQLVGESLMLGHILLEQEGAQVQPIDARGIPFGPEIQVVQHDRIERTLPVGGSVQAAVSWQLRGETEAVHNIVIEFLAEDGDAPLARHEVPLAYDYPTTAWQAGEAVRVVYAVETGDLPAGDYRLRLGVVGQEPTLELGRVRIVGERSYALPEMSPRIDARLGEGIELLGADLPAEEVRPGETLPLRLYWRADAPQEDYKVFVHLVGQNEQIIAQEDARPAGWQRPTTTWAVGEVIADEYALVIPDEAPPGAYRLYVGMYHATSFQRLPIRALGTDPVADDRLLLQQVTVRDGSER